ncbi:MAG: hypothetical protein FD157_4120 [Rhodocyclaceae bacterium]|nr:MAG: hypothetical protein FD157_4120 [Rhodocyclaceae bacterium]TNC97260.1 MAG: hypothetical protein FD118_4132 [Rhodocyclaceae bacterium]
MKPTTERLPVYVLTKITMPQSELHSGDDLLALRTHINRLAIACDLDINHGDTVTRLLAGEFSHDLDHGREVEVLRALLVLLYRLEASVSEDLGIDGLVRLWQQHNKVLVLHGFPVHSQPVPNGPEA